MKAYTIKRFTKQFLLLLILFFLSSVSVANKKIKVENVSAEVEVKGDVSPNMALKKCINDAKVEALRKAGVSESVKAQELLFTSEVNKDFKICDTHLIWGPEFVNEWETSFEPSHR